MPKFLTTGGGGGGEGGSGHLSASVAMNSALGLFLLHA